VSDLIEKKGVGDDLATRVIASALVRAEAIGLKVTVAVVDESGVLKAFRRADGAPVAGVQIAPAKARLAAGLGIPTTALREAVRADASIAISLASSMGSIALFEGGEPLIADGAVVGAIGVSGGSEEQDAEIAQAGAAEVSGAN
jgi:uncharacterized protein GlcG (DUF336 family)